MKTKKKSSEIHRLFATNFVYSPHSLKSCYFRMFGEHNISLKIVSSTEISAKTTHNNNKHTHTLCMNVWNVNRCELSPHVERRRKKIEWKKMASVISVPVRSSRLKIINFRQFTFNYSTNSQFSRKINSAGRYWWCLLGGSVLAGSLLKWQPWPSVSAFNPKKIKVSKRLLLVLFINKIGFLFSAASTEPSKRNILFRLLLFHRPFFDFGLCRK